MTIWAASMQGHIMRVCAVFSLLAVPCVGKTRVTVSGQSAGGSMAMQHLVAYSASVDGACIAAGSPYGCGGLPRPNQACDYGPIDVQRVIEYIKEKEQEGTIDSTSNLWETPVVLFNGKSDQVVYVQVMQDTYKQLLAFVDPTQLVRRFSTAAAHVWSLDHGECDCGACANFGASMKCCDVNNCQYDLTGEMFTLFYGPLLPRVPAKPRRLFWVKQSNYIPKGPGRWKRSGIWNWGLVYVPTGCAEDPNQCRIHINYHGCIRKDSQERRLWASTIDLNEYGEANDIVIVYPQAAGDYNSGYGCWNWGSPQDDPLFDTRESVQLRTVISLTENLKEAVGEGIVVEVGDIDGPRSAMNSTASSLDFFV
mmetsp:Transcript_47752/g.103944  ORF Transcript_47752/g.103944 Transcript_47752/m.103944 type:complete len:366 (-) Transcript_47752:174-1271(-)